MNETEMSPTVLAEALLIERARQGDHAAYGVLVDRYSPLLMRVTQRLLHDPAQAEDACQDAFLRAYTHLETYNPTYRFSTWLRAIATHHCLHLLTRRNWEYTGTDHLTVSSAAFLDDDPELKVLLEEQAEGLRQAVADLPMRYRRALVLRHWHDLSYVEIATATGQSLGAVKTQLRRARVMLAQSLRARGNAHALN